MRPALVLIVDDNLDHRTITSVALRGSGYRVAEATNGRDAIDKSMRLKPDLILMDASMPGMSGWEATERLRVNPTTRSIPVIAVSALPEYQVAEMARDAGCDGFLIKPCQHNELCAAIAAHLKST